MNREAKRGRVSVRLFDLLAWNLTRFAAFKGESIGDRELLAVAISRVPMSTSFIPLIPLISVYAHLRA